GFSVRAFSGSPRKHVLGSPRFYFFDLGVRHAASGLKPSIDTARANPGPLLEQWVAIELQRRIGYARAGSLTFFRTKGGAEIDFIVDTGKTLVPIEVKWTETPTARDARHLITFLREQGRRAPLGYVICRCAAPRRLADGITAIPWWAV